jgi:hypothetical protein
LLLLSSFSNSKSTKRLLTISEELILAAAKEMVSTMLRETGCMEIKAISLSNNTVQCSTGEITENIKEQMTRTHSSCFYALQLDKFTDITKLSSNLRLVK